MPLVRAPLRAPPSRLRHCPSCLPQDPKNPDGRRVTPTHPDEVVLLGGHLDSWDLGEGTTDNGAGAMVVLEAARALAASHVKPERTIRFVLFTGEEEGLF